MSDTNTAQMVAELKATDDAVLGKGWVAPGLGVPGASLGLLNSTLNPLSGLAAAGLGWFMPLVSFLGDGLTQLQGGNGASVTSGSQDFGAAGRDIGGLADTYQASTRAQTANWSGAAAAEHREAVEQHATGVAGLGQASNMTGSAILGAGQVVAQAIAEVMELIAEAVAEIVPIMTQAIARAGETFGQSVVEAIPPCVGIAITYAVRIAAKLAALVASGDNLMKLVQGGMAVVDLLKTALSNISQQSVRPDAEPQANAAGAEQSKGSEAASAVSALKPAGTGSSENAGSSTPASSGGGSGGGTPGGLSIPDAPQGSAATHSSGAVPSVPSVPSSHSTMPDASRLPGSSGGVSTSGGPSGGAPMGALAPGARVGAGGDTVRQESRSPSARAAKGGAAAPGAFPMGGMAGARPAGDTDKEHERKYNVVENHDDEDFQVAPPVITSIQPKA